jgi:hypothetical protein
MVAFRCYDPSADGTGGIHHWYYKEISPEIQSEIDGALELMSLEAKLDENHPSFKALRGKGLGLAEIKIDIPVLDDTPTAGKRKGKQKRRKKTEINVRLLGPNEPPNTCFILLTGFIKLGGSDYGPACRRAHQRRKGVKRNANKVRPCHFPKAKNPR